MLEPTLQDRTKYFDLEDFVADKAYSSKKILMFLSTLGLNPIIPFKKNARPRSKYTPDCDGDMFIWRKMFYYFRDHQDEFMKRYHVRSNVETVFHMIKKKFGNSVKTKSMNSNNNEIKIKCLCHNICVLIQESFESGIEIDFKSCVNKID